jgi:hypothetical protein
MGFSERTCLPARRAFLINSGWNKIGRLVAQSAYSPDIIGMIDAMFAGRTQ